MFIEDRAAHCRVCVHERRDRERRERDRERRERETEREERERVRG